MRELEAVSSTLLVDMEWLDRCPALASLRDVAGFATVRERVGDRIAELWAL